MHSHYFIPIFLFLSILSLFYVLSTCNYFSVAVTVDRHAETGLLTCYLRRPDEQHDLTSNSKATRTLPCCPINS